MLYYPPMKGLRFFQPKFSYYFLRWLDWITRMQNKSFDFNKQPFVTPKTLKTFQSMIYRPGKVIAINTILKVHWKVMDSCIVYTLICEKAILRFKMIFC